MRVVLRELKLLPSSLSGIDAKTKRENFFVSRFFRLSLSCQLGIDPRRDLSASSLGDSELFSR